MHNWTPDMTQITDLIARDHKALDSSATIASAQAFFDDNPYSHFPVLEDGTYIGCIAAEDAETFEPEKTIAQYRYTFEAFYARTNMIWLDLMEVFARNHTNLIPVLDDDNQYAGYYEVSDIIAQFSETPFLKELGNVIIVEKGVTDYSIGQITQIVESNNGRILGAFVSEASNDRIQVTVKIAVGSVNDIIQTFRRYDYKIISEHREDNYLNNLKERSDYLDRYLNI